MSEIMPIDKDAPVVVVGAGPSGLACALALNALSVPVRVIEADTESAPRPGSRALFLHNDSLQSLSRFCEGLGEKFAEQGLVWSKRETFYSGKSVYSHQVDKQYKKNGLPPFISLRQRDTEKLLRQACCEQGVQITWDSPVQQVISNSDNIQITGNDFSVNAHYVIGADGAHSSVRKSSGLEFEGDSAKGTHIVVDFICADSPYKNKRTFHYRHPKLDHRHVLIIPFAGGWQVDLQCKLNDDIEYMSSAQGVREWLIQIIDKEFIEHIDWVSTYHFNQLVANNFTDEFRRVLLIGEAAHLFPPYGARGLNSGIADAEMASQAILLASHVRHNAHRKFAIEEFNRYRKSAALRNCDAARQALRYIRAPSTLDKLKQRMAVLLSGYSDRYSRWLDAAPYGPVWKADRNLSRY